MLILAQPQWIAKMYEPKKGRDHLGLGSVSSDQILPRLSPGINVLTIYPRYHSFYVFLLDEFWRRDRIRSWASWGQFYRPREFVFSVGVFLCDRPEHAEAISAVGGQKTAPLAKQQRDSYDTQTDYIKSEWGGYGLYYRSVMIELGLVYPGGPGFPYPMDIPTEFGKEVAAAFRQAIQHTSYYRDYFDHDVIAVPREVIKAYIHHACLCQLQMSTAPDRSLLLGAFLHAGNDTSAISRRETLRLLLDITEQTQGTAIDQDTYRQLLYFQAASIGVAYQPQSSLQEVFQRWRYYQAREYYAFALNAMWYYLCEWGITHDGDIHPLPLEAFWQHLDESLNVDALAAQLQLSAPGLRADDDFVQLLEWLQTLIGAEKSGFDAACSLESPLQEDRLYHLAARQRRQPHIMVAGMLIMLCLIYLRFGLPERWKEPAWDISQMGLDGRLSKAEFILAFRSRLQKRSMTIKDITKWLFTDYIMLQHQLVAASKLPENTFRFQREGNRLRFYRLENPLGFMDSRFLALSTTIHELVHAQGR